MQSAHAGRPPWRLRLPQLDQRVQAEPRGLLFAGFRERAPNLGEGDVGLAASAGDRRSGQEELRQIHALSACVRDLNRFVEFALGRIQSPASVRASAA